MSHHQILAKLHLIALFLWIVMKYQPEERITAVQLLTQQCLYDTTIICPECFPEPVNCSYFENFITIDDNELLGGIVSHFDQHGVRYGSLKNSEQRIVIKNLNRKGVVQESIGSICNELDIAETENCQILNGEAFVRVLRRRALDENLLEGAIFCPAMDEQALDKFLGLTDECDLNKILLMRVNAQPLLLKILKESNFPIPKFIFQGGFTLVESYEGETLAKFYDRPLKDRLLIANELIKASLNFTTGIYSFRFYLTDISPDNIVVHMPSHRKIKVTFVDLNNVIILDSHSKRLNQHKHTHARIYCDGCFAYVQEDICTHQSSDINLFAVCQLLLENLNGDSGRGFLHSLGADPKEETLRSLLQHCVYCQPPYCEDRQELLHRIMKTIQDVV
nr:uncharacterized protein LOC115270967 [Aedes albopictus]